MIKLHSNQLVPLWIMCIAIGTVCSYYLACPRGNSTHTLCTLRTTCHSLPLCVVQRRHQGGFNWSVYAWKQWKQCGVTLLDSFSFGRLIKSERSPRSTVSWNESACVEPFAPTVFVSGPQHAWIHAFAHTPALCCCHLQRTASICLSTSGMQIRLHMMHRHTKS